MGYDEHSLSAHRFSILSKRAKLEPSSRLIKEPRVVKEPMEIKSIRKAVRITEKVLGGIELVGKSEAEVAADIDCGFRRLGAGNAFETIVAGGPNSGFIHYRPGGRRILSNDMVVVDLGARFNGYCADMTRTFCAEPGSREKEIHENILGVQGKLIDEVVAGADFKGIQKIYKGLMEKLGYKVYHSFGHGIGLSEHEGIGESFKESMVITVEPGAYIKGWGGCRIEDVVLVGKGKAKVLSGFTRELQQP